MGAQCNKALECIGYKSDRNDSLQLNKQNSSSRSSLSLIPSKGKSRSSLSNIQQKQQLNKSDSKNSLKGNNQRQNSIDSASHLTTHDHLGPDYQGNDGYDHDSESQQKVMKKIDSQKYILKHSNLSAILEEDEQHKDSLKLIRRKQSKDAKKDPYNEDSRPNSLLVLQTFGDQVEDQEINPKKSSNLATIVEDEQTNYLPIQNQNIGISIETILPNYKELSAEALQKLYDILSKDCEIEGFTKEHDSSETSQKGKQQFSTIFTKPVDDGKYKYFKIITEYNLYGCSSRDYLKLTTDPKWSKANNSSIEDFILVSSQNDYHIVYIEYKKLPMCSPRDFIYLKLNKQINKKTYASVQFSIDISSYPPFKNKERGIIVLSGSIISEEIDQNGEKFLKLVNYTESNLKLTLAHKLTKSLTVKELKKFIQNNQEIFQKTPLQ